jgi:hypothetical protein
MLRRLIAAGSRHLDSRDLARNSGTLQRQARLVGIGGRRPTGLAHKGRDSSSVSQPIGFGLALHGGLFGVFAVFDQLGFLCFHHSTAFPLLVVAVLGHLDQFLAFERESSSSESEQ